MHNKIILTLIAAALVFLNGVPSADARNFNNKKSTAKDNPKYASLVMDAGTGQILSQRYADKVLHPASLTKIMTMLLTFEALDSGKVKKHTRIRISRRAASMVPSKLDLPVGSSIKVEDAIFSLATKSANDVAVALAEHLAGSESRFANAMTARARSIGMKNTKFRNASGLPDKRQVTTARDMAKLARYILKRYPHHYKYFSTRSFTYRGKTYKNHNKLLSTYRGADGFKTGYINASGFNLVASAYRSGHRLIGVVFGGQTGNSRNAHMVTLLNSGFKKVDNRRTAKKLIKPAPLPKTKPTYGIANAKKNAPVKTAHASQSSPTTTKITYKLPTPPQHKPTNIKTSNSNYSALNTALQNGKFVKAIGQGDFDPSLAKRLETGLIAVAAHQGQYNSTTSENLNAIRTINNNGSLSIPHPRDVVGKWAIQIGAYTSRLKTDESLQQAKKKLPSHLRHANAMTVPLDTKKGMIFRARLGSMSEAQARNACQYFKNCITVAPIATKVSTNATR